MRSRLPADPAEIQQRLRKGEASSTVFEASPSLSSLNSTSLVRYAKAHSEENSGAQNVPTAGLRIAVAEIVSVDVLA